MPATLEAPTEANPFADLIPKAPTDYGQFADLVPSALKSGASVAGQEDYGQFSDLVPKSPTGETEKVVADTPTMSEFDQNFQAAEKFVSTSTGIPFHESMNALRSLSAGAGKYIFEGLQGFEQNRAKMLANPPSELTKPQGDEFILPDGSVMSKEQQDALEQRYHDAAIAQIPDAKAKADYFKRVAENADASQYVDPELAKTIPARIAHAAGAAGVMAVESMLPFGGIPFMVMHGAMATEAEAKNAGKTDAEAETAGVRSAIGLALFGAASKLAALGVAKLLPDGASSVRTFLTQFVGQEAANETSSRAINAWESAVDAPEGKKIEAALNALKDTTLEQSTLNTVYALAHATKAAGKEPVRPEAAPEQEPPLINDQKLPDEIANQAKPLGEPNVSESTSMGLGTHARGDESLGRLGESERMGSSESAIPQTAEETAQAAKEGPITEDSLPETIGPNVKGFDKIYGLGEISPGKSITSEKLFEQGQSDLSAGKDPYAFSDRARTGDVSPRELGLLAAEHQRLVGEAAATEGTPEYEAKYQQARDFAQNMLKPAGTKWHQVGMGLQIEAPIDFSNVTGFRAAIEQRFKREITPDETRAFSRMAKDVANAKNADFIELGKTADRVRQRFKGVKDVPFEDAVKELRGRIDEALKGCVL